MRFVALLICGTLMCAAAFAQAPPDGAEFKTVHLFNLKSAAGEQKLLSMLGEFNAMFVKIGERQIRYRVWKTAAEPRGTTRYIWESIWPTRALYLKVHNLPQYKALFDRLSPEIAQLMSDHVYDQYVALK